MARIARKCTKCGAIDARRTGESTEKAAEDDALGDWTCPSCAWPEAELVTAEPEAAEARAR